MKTHHTRPHHPPKSQPDSRLTRVEFCKSDSLKNLLSLIKFVAQFMNLNRSKFETCLIPNCNELGILPEAELSDSDMAKIHAEAKSLGLDPDAIGILMQMVQRTSLGLAIENSKLDPKKASK